MRTKLTLCVYLILTLVLASCGKKSEQLPSSPLERAQVLLDHYQFDAADSAFTQQEKAQPKLPWSRYGEAVSNERRFLIWEALPAYFKITERYPGFRPAQEGKARIIRQLGHPFDAAIIRQLVIDSGGADGRAYYELARDLIAASEYSRARRAAQRAAEAGLDAGSAFFEQAAALAGQDKRDSAVQLANRGFENPDTTALYLQSAADYYEAVGQIDSSMMFSRRAFAAGDASYDMRLAHFNRSLRLGYLFEARRFMDGENRRGAGDSILTAIRIFYDMGRGAYAAAKDDNDMLCFYKVSWNTCNAYLLWTHPKGLDLLTPAEIRPELYAKLMSPDRAPEFNEFAYYYFEMLVSDWGLREGIVFDLYNKHRAAGT